MGAHEHHAKAKRVVACAVLTVSDTRTAENDTNGTCIQALLEQAGHRVASYTILPDEPGLVRAHLEGVLDDPEVDVVILNGGTGLAPRDSTYEAIVDLLEKRLDGFGELFRMLSYEHVGAAAMLSRAAAGVARGKVVAALPGATAAVELAMTKLLLPELGHMVQLVRG
ncbi:MAG: molybdenum cofactor biosynthesis protein MoaB [Deltaproteobacteria bacterium]|nr:MAG: molybdenum cofactor biosynthesis protein MoaB [Deltaproteobacteria bacterium]